MGASKRNILKIEVGLFYSILQSSERKVGVEGLETFNIVDSEGQAEYTMVMIVKEGPERKVAPLSSPTNY